MHTHVYKYKCVYKCVYMYVYTYIYIYVYYLYTNKPEKKNAVCPACTSKWSNSCLFQTKRKLSDNSKR